jgi:hypothetical protein
VEEGGAEGSEDEAVAGIEGLEVNAFIGFLIVDGLPDGNGNKEAREDEVF